MNACSTTNVLLFLFVTMSLLIISMFVKPVNANSVENFYSYRNDGNGYMYSNHKFGNYNQFSDLGELNDFNEFGRRIHVKLDKDGKAVYHSFQQPSGNGELGCTQVPCPDGYSDTAICWCCCGFH